MLDARRGPAATWRRAPGTLRPHRRAVAAVSFGVKVSAKVYAPDALPERVFEDVPSRFISAEVLSADTRDDPLALIIRGLLVEAMVTRERLWRCRVAAVVTSST